MSALSDGDVARLARLVETPEIPGGRYEIVELLGRGGMGTVFLARDAALARTVAIKVLNPMRDAGDLPQRLEREARTIAKLDHASVVPIHEIGVLEDGRPYYVMKHVVGATLRAWRERNASHAEALRVFLRLCEAVAHAHELGIVHRDLKPDNVMVGRFGELYVVDWGLAKSVGAAPGGPPSVGTSGAKSGAGSSHEAASSGAARVARASERTNDGVDTGYGAVLGTPAYMAPEQARGRNAEVDARADVYALGGILAFVWNARDPDEGDEPTGGASRPLRAIAGKCRAADPRERYPSARELAADVAAFLDQEPVTAHRENVLERLERLLARHRFVVWLVLGYLILRALVFFFGRR